MAGEGTAFALALPPQASAHAVELDWMMAGFALLTALFTVPVFVLLAYFAIKYRRGSAADRTARPRGNLWLEIGWMVVPFVTVLGFFLWSGWLYFGLGTPPRDALEINVVAKQWMWKFQHPGGQREIDNLHVPVGRPVKLIMTSQDVIHSLFLPALRIKQDVLPGRYTTMWFTAEKTGEFRLHCAEFCGINHAAMGGHFVIMQPRDYARWLEEAGTDRSLAAAGEALFRRYGCSGCHGAASDTHSPRLEGLFGSPVPLADGRVIVADERYIRDSIVLPNSEIAAGYRPIMPSFRSLLSEDDILMLVAYIKSLRVQRPVQR